MPEPAPSDALFEAMSVEYTVPTAPPEKYKPPPPYTALLADTLLSWTLAPLVDMKATPPP